LTYEEWIKVLESSRPFAAVRTYMSQDFGVYEALTFVSGWSRDTAVNESILFATLPVKGIVSLLADRDVASRGFIRLYDVYGNLLLEENNSGENEAGNFHIVKERSGISGLGFEIGVPDFLIAEKMMPVKRLLWFIFAGIMVFVIMLSLVFAYKGSEPMRKLLAIIDMTKNVKVEYEQHQKDTTGFLKHFRRIYSDLAESIFVVDTRLENSLQTIEWQTNTLRGQFFERALYRGIYDTEEQMRFLELFPDFPLNFHLALIRYDLSHEVPVPEAAAIQLRLVAKIRDRLDRVFVHSMDSHSVKS
jgi:hypothetical protein